MRATIGDVLHHPTWAEDWWADLPMRRRAWWYEVLWSPGEGWLRWRSDWREQISYEPPDLDQWQVYPPLHRAWLVLRGAVMHPVWVLRGHCGWNEWVSWSEVSVLKSEDRKRLFS